MNINTQVQPQYRTKEVLLMITVDQALEIAREHLKEEVAIGGMPTLFGVGDAWLANCTFPDGKGIRENSLKIRIARRDGSVTRILSKS